MGKNKYFGATKKVSLLPILLVVFCCIVTLTIAFFFSDDFATGHLGISGKVQIVAVGKGDEYNSIENGVTSTNLVIELDNGHDTLIPGMPLRMDANCKVKRSTTKPLLRAWLNLGLYNTETMDKIEDWNENAGVIVDINNQLDTIITGSSKWVLADDGFYYYINSKNAILGDSILEEIDATAGDVVIHFIDKAIKFPTSVDSDYSGLGVKIRITFQAIQNYIPDENGQKLPNTIDNSYKIFNAFGSMYESTPISMFDTVENSDGTITIKAKPGVTYPNTLNLPAQTADGKPITKIADGAFSGNKNITNVYIPSSYTVLGSNAFASSSVLNVDARDSKLKILSTGSFNLSTLTSIKFPDTLEEIGPSALYNCGNLTSLFIPANVKTLADGFLLNCKNIKSLKVDPNNPYFYDVDGLSIVSKDGRLKQVATKYPSYEYTLDERITSVSQGVFTLGCTITTINLNKIVDGQINWINGYNFTNISYINLCGNPNYTYVMDDYGNKFLTWNSAPDALTFCELSDSAINLNIPANYTSIVNQHNFKPYTLRKNIRYINIGSLPSKYLYTYHGDFNNRELYFADLINFEVSSTNPEIKTLTGKELLSLDGKIMYNYAKKSAETTYTIPSTVDTIRSFIFRDAQFLTELKMGTNVKKIENNCIRNNIITKLTLSGVVGADTGTNMKQIKEVVLLNSVTSLDSWFMGSNCNLLETLEFQSTTVPTINTNGFLNCLKNKTTFKIYVPDSAVETFKSASALADFVDRIYPVSEKPAS